MVSMSRIPPKGDFSIPCAQTVSRTQDLRQLCVEGTAVGLARLMETLVM